MAHTVRHGGRAGFHRRLPLDKLDRAKQDAAAIVHEIVGEADA
jgi:hypothetical protein